MTKLIVAVLVLFALPMPPAGGQAAQTPAKPAGFAVEAGETGRIVAAYQQLTRAVDRTNFDVKARAAALGPTPEAALAFVRDQIGNDLYPGVLRGAAGTLSAGSGNDLDKSLLLGALLAAGGHNVRYAHCTLSPAGVRARVTALFADTARRRPAETDIAPAFKAALRQAGIGEQRATDILAARQTRRAWLDTAVLLSANADLDLVRAMLKQSGVVPAPTSTDGALMAEAREHYWLQLDRGGSWADLDPGEGGAVARDAHCTASETFAQPPASVFQTITIEVRNEFAADQKLSSTTALTHRFRVSDAYGSILILDNVGVGRTGGTGLLQFGGVEQYKPAFQIGDTIVVGSAFTVVPPDGGGFADALSGGSGGPTLVAQWLDFTLDAPGRRSKTSRALADFVPPAERAAGIATSTPNAEMMTAALAQSCAIAVSAGRVDAAAALETAYGAADAAAIGRLHDAPKPIPATVLDDAQDAHRTMLGALALSYAVASERQLAALDARAGKTVRVIRDQPMVTIANIAVRPRNDGRTFVAELSVDYRHAVARTIADDPAHATDAFWTNAMAGLVDGAVEHHLTATSLGNSASSSAEPFTTRTALALARSQNVEVRAWSGAAISTALNGGLSDAGGKRLLRETAGKTVLVGPASPVQLAGERRFAGWVLNLESGRLVALTDAGLHGAQSPAERKLLELTRALGDCLASTTAAFGRCRALYYVWRRQALTVLINGVPEGASVIPNFWQLLILA